ncbi:hypothetical protein CN326_19120 [Bacillus sp. AFS018417]|uniref:hypothetical protein n=1 Tax=Bacillus sp. AFS018417 TaxID=2033491 RepID=UPI000BF3FB7A|nr:hypothetical protein [Bacillus sp. AFS018417]PEZ02906.1 hypothetical protein CN326_19120 [Bacillus sp. AFS018417]
MKTLCKNIIASGIAFTLFTGGDFLLPSTPSYIKTVSAAASTNNPVEQEARQAVSNFFSAQKSGNVEQMIKYSTYIPDITNLKELYTQFNKQHPLLNASITDAKVINHSLVIISTEIHLKDRVVISTTPVYKENNHWKIIRGIPPQGYTETNSLHKAATVENEAQKVIQNCIKAIESGKIDDLLTHLYIASPYSNEQVKQHFIRLSKDSTKTELKQLTVVGKSLALVKLEQDFGNYKISETIPMFKESNQWKLVFGQRLTSDSIPIGTNVQKIK